MATTDKPKPKPKKRPSRKTEHKVPLEKIELAAEAPLAAGLGAYSRELFCREYATLRNGAQAAIKAGYAPGSARETALWLLKDLAVQARINRLMIERLQLSGITGDRVMMALGRLAFAGDLRDIFDVDGRILPPADWNDDIAEAITSIELDADGRVIKVRRQSRDPALGYLARHFKIVGIEIDETISAQSEVADRLRRANERHARKMLEIEMSGGGNVRVTVADEDT